MIHEVQKITVVMVKLSIDAADPSVEPEGPAVVKVMKSNLIVQISVEIKYIRIVRLLYLNKKRHVVWHSQMQFDELKNAYAELI